MEAKSSLGQIRISPRKMRLVADVIRGYEFVEAVDMLKNVPKNSSTVILKALKSAAANAKIINPDIEEGDLYVKKIFVDQGPLWKRFRARARGRADQVKRRTSQLTIVLADD